MKKIQIKVLDQTEYLNFFLGKAYYRDIKLYFVYHRQYKQWFSSGPEFFNEAICKKARNKNFNLKAFARQYYHVEKKKKETVMLLVIWTKRKLWGIGDI